MMTQELTVGTLTKLIKETLEDEFRYVRVVGEVSNYKLAASGHHYFNIKDDEAQIRCVMWKNNLLRIQPSDGMRVIVSGKLTVYPPTGAYQISCSTIEPAGIGDLYLAFEKLKTELLELGYFDADRKRSIPRFPQAVGIATSASGAVIHDILTTLRERMPLIRVYFRPTLVQGPGSPEDIVRAISDLQSFPCDVLIVGRGGGSIEDLWSFNTRPVADAIYNSRIPIISAVGHETDTSIADMVADLRAPTPSLAAVACSRTTIDDFRMTIDDIADQITSIVMTSVDDLSAQSRKWLNGDVGKLVLRQFQFMTANVRTGDWLDGSVERMVVRRTRLATSETDSIRKSIVQSSKRKLHDGTRDVAHASQMLRSLRPLAPLDRGFALIYKNNHVVRGDEQLQSGDVVEIRRTQEFHKARIE